MIPKSLRTIILLIALMAVSGACAQRYALKNNVLYDATLTPNLGAEVQLDSTTTVQLFYGINPWSGGDKWIKHWVLMPEYRHWFDKAFKGWFVGAHLMGGEFNINNVRFPLLPSIFKKGMREEGWFLGWGATVGYQWNLSERWNLEASLGLGYVYIHYDRYKCGHCGDHDRNGHANYFGPTKAALSLVYFIK